jgi:hypothetical protein
MSDPLLSRSASAAHAANGTSMIDSGALAWASSDSTSTRSDSSLPHA